MNKHNLRDYDNQRELITTIYGTNDIVEDVKQVYLDEFEQARIEYNTNLRYNKAHIHSIFDKKIKEIDNEYLASYVNMRKYPTILFVMAKIMEMNSQEQNQIAMYLYNTIKMENGKLSKFL